VRHLTNYKETCRIFIFSPTGGHFLVDALILSESDGPRFGQSSR
jgi:hypothetical protein